MQSAKGGIHYLTYDGLDKLEEQINNNQSEALRRTHGPEVKTGFLKDTFNLLKLKHSLCEELRWIGQEAANYDNVGSSWD